MIHIAKNFKKMENKRFWPWAKCTNSIGRMDPGAQKYRHKFDVMFGPGKFIRIRHYSGPDGDRRKTVEIEIEL